jgi:hypothetical protein
VAGNKLLLLALLVFVILANNKVDGNREGVAVVSFATFIYWCYCESYCQNW